ncbi:MAG TPA: hypothetical protein DDZ83_13740, partial [Nitrospinae bacterium]|nr:hypothetical protein [Nitrospinota bacterium]
MRKRTAFTGTAIALMFMISAAAPGPGEADHWVGHNLIEKAKKTGQKIGKTVNEAVQKAKK